MTLFRTTMLAALATAATLAAPAEAAVKKGMTWASYDFASSTNAAQAAGWATLKTNEAADPVVVVGCKNSCDAYQGDTKATLTRRILCFVPGTLPEPADYAAVFTPLAMNNTASSDWHFYYGWSGGRVGLTAGVVGTTITSRAAGDQMCATALNEPTARMAEHHDNQVGGWALGARIHPNSQAKILLTNPGSNPNVRFWTAINDQPANVW